MSDHATEQELQQKLVSIGRLAGGIAHDANNILTGIMGNLSLLEIASHNREQARLLQEIEKACGRARDLNNQLLVFSKGGAPVKSSANLGELIRETSEFVLRGSNSHANYLIDDNLWAAELDGIQISQVIQNLVINADQAMAQGGQIGILAGNLIINDQDLGGLPPGRYVRTRVSDEGPGIAKESLGKIFDPYFTTKPEGHGLGLATSYAIVEKHEGILRAQNAPGGGAEFEMVLPASSSPVSHTIITETYPGISESLRILLMDDEESILEVVQRLAKKLGHSCVCARYGEEALRLCQEAADEGNPFQFAILDLTIPGTMGGTEAVHQLKAIDSEIVCIVSSGYSNDSIMNDAAAWGFSGVLRKPYTKTDLNTVLCKARKDHQQKKSSSSPGAFQPLD